MILDLSVCFQQCFFIIQRRVILKKNRDSISVRYTDACCFWLKSLGIHCLYYTQLCVCFYLKLVLIKPRTNGHNIVGQQLPTLLDVTCCVRLHSLLHVVGCCCVLLRKVWNRSNFSANNSQQFLLIRLHSSSNTVGATHTHYAWFTKTYGLYPSHDALQVPTLLGVVASVCTPLPTRTQQLPTLLAQQCWELLRPFARSLRMSRFWIIVTHMDKAEDKKQA